MRKLTLGLRRKRGSSAVGASSTSRKDRAFGAEVAPANASGPVLAQATVSAALAGAGPGGSDLVRTDQRTQLVPARAQAFTYDADGNLTADGLWLYTYDAENRLVRMTSALPDGFGASLGHVRLRLDFKYDYQGRRIEKRVTNLDTSVETLARRFIYEGWNLIAEIDGLAPATLPLTRSYAWGLDKWGGLTDSGGPGGLLQITAYVNGAPTGNYYPGYDHQGNVVSLTRASDGFLAAVYEYDPFGNPVRSEPFDPAVADQPFRYANKWRDEETGLVYYGHRYYSPTMGRFINQDPIGEAGGLNLYGFVGNNVVNLSDYLGWETTDADRFNGGDPLEGFGIDFGSSTVRSGNYGGSIFWDLFNTQEELAATTLIDQANQALDGDQPPPEVQTAPPDVVVADPGPAPGPTANNLLDGIFFVASPGVESPSVPPSAPRATGPVTLTASGGGTAIGTGGSGGTATTDVSTGTTGTNNGTAADTVTISGKNTGADKTSTGSTTVQDASNNPGKDADTPGSDVDLPADSAVAPNSAVANGAVGVGGNLVEAGLVRDNYNALVAQLRATGQYDPARDVIRAAMNAPENSTAMSRSMATLYRWTQIVAGVTSSNANPTATSVAMNNAAALAKYGGGALVVVGTGVSVVTVATAPDPYRAGAQQSAGIIVGYGGAVGGASLGAAIGTAIFPGLGTGIGAVVGAVVGGIGGGYAGQKLGTGAYDSIYGPPPPP